MVCLPLVLALVLYFFSPSFSSPKKYSTKNQVLIEKTNKGAAKSSKTELKVAFVAIVQVFNSVFQPVNVSIVFIFAFVALIIYHIKNDAFSGISYFRHLFTHVIATNAP
jgi:uncharacterized membrane protein